MIPKDIKDKIEAEAMKADNMYHSFWKGAEFGYSLASPKQDEQEQLWEEARRMVHGSEYHTFISNIALQELSNQFTITRKQC